MMSLGVKVFVALDPIDLSWRFDRVLRCGRRTGSVVGRARSAVHVLREDAGQQGGGSGVALEESGPKIMGYGPSGIKGDSGAAALGGAANDTGAPITDAMIKNGTIPVAKGRLPIPKAVQIAP